MLGVRVDQKGEPVGGAVSPHTGTKGISIKTLSVLIGLFLFDIPDLGS